VCPFDPRSPRITAYQIHKWIYEELKLPKNDVHVIQVDVPRRRVFIKFAKNEWMQYILQATKGQMEFRHDNSDLSMVQIQIAGMGMRRIRIAIPPPELPNRTIGDVLTKYGEDKEITEDAWSRTYRYPVSNGVRMAVLSLKQHIPSHMTIRSNKILISYEGQPPTCYGCKGTGHQYQNSPSYKQVKPIPHNAHDLVG